MDKTVKLILGFVTIVFLAILFGAHFLGASFMYLLPTIIAYLDRHKKFSQIFVINILFGWTGIAWLWMLIVALNVFRKGRLDTVLLTTSLKHDTWDTLKATFRNVGTEELHSIELKFTDDFITREATTYSIKAGEELTIKIPIRATNSGSVPLKITITYQDSSGKSYTQIDEEWINVALH